ncbi:probable leucine--tRNA ligase, mitochondrial [Anopheles aquasalis]|uniref:probable leucine--tRNA ligase, mitochondrial n=1 Tax=Anopheles aquasalis TaxID=42839 RepID=UPI00215AF5B1|nr:probable leucine--tRNA ligase, mitochondrial [Anopheles aquasalis]
MRLLQWPVVLRRFAGFQRRRHLCSSASDAVASRELTSEMKLQIEERWQNKLGDSRFDPSATDKAKRYVLAMFPYPSGNLHMGHVRVYTISDAMARFYRLNGANVLHPMGWDAFGLPAENAAIQRCIPADKWTQRNIAEMRKQLEMLAFSFDWEREFATCDPSYYHWTQQLFLMLFKDGLAYQREAQVNWDPIDQTVLADEQVDDNGCSWRSGAKVEKKVLRQWFIKTTRFAKPLLEGLNDPSLEDWKDIIKLQRHWIGECEGYAFELPLADDAKGASISIWTREPTDLRKALFIALHPSNLLNTSKGNDCVLKVECENPFTGRRLPVIVTENVPFAEGCDTYLAVDSEENRKIAQAIGLKKSDLNGNNDGNGLSNDEILSKALSTRIGGHAVSSKLRDWLISRQRFWGTPIPIIHCPSCGPVAVPEQDLPVRLPTDSVGVPLAQNAEWLRAECPSCKRTDCQRESDTMDTFVDSSWYFLRFADPHNSKAMFDRSAAHHLMPVDLYVGGKEHAVLHLYYARFVAHYLHSKGLLSAAEPFKRLLVQGMVMGRSYRVVSNGKYIPAAEAEIVDEKNSKAIERATGEPVTLLWEKMSKSKLNGVDPLEVLRQHGCDTLRLILLADVAPTSHRNWSEATFPGILNWQKRIWMTMYDFREIRSKLTVGEGPPSTEEYKQHEHQLWDARNYFTAGATFNYRHSHQLSVGISKMQGLTNAIRRVPPEVIAFSRQYELALAAQILMLAPMAPHFAAELWQQFLTVPNRATQDTESDTVIRWNGGVFDQRWPEIDQDFPLDLTFKINGAECCILKIPAKRFNVLTHQESLDIALKQEPILKLIGKRPLRTSEFTLYPSCEAFLAVELDRALSSDGEVVKDKKEKKEKKHKKKKSLQVVHIG